MDEKRKLIEKELELEKIRLESKIETLEHKRKEYGIDYDGMQEQIDAYKHFLMVEFLISNAVALIPIFGILANPLYTILSFPAKKTVFSSSFLDDKNEKSNNKKFHKVKFFSPPSEVSYNNLKTLEINFDIEHTKIQKEIVEKALEINKENYRTINSNVLDTSNERNSRIIDVVAEHRAINNSKFIQSNELRSIKKTLGIDFGFKFLGTSEILFLFSILSSFNLPVLYSLAVGGAFFSVSMSLDKFFEDNNEEDYKKCFGEGIEKYNNIEKLNTVISDTIEKEAYKKVNEYNKDLESIIRKRKINEYYKMKESIIDIIECENQKDKEKKKVKYVKTIKSV